MSAGKAIQDAIADGMWREHMSSAVKAATPDIGIIITASLAAHPGMDPVTPPPTSIRASKIHGPAVTKSPCNASSSASQRWAREPLWPASGRTERQLPAVSATSRWEVIVWMASPAILAPMPKGDRLNFHFIDI